MFDYERDIYRNMVHRAVIKEILNDDGDKLQQARASGYKGEELETHRAQTHGFSSSPPVGSIGYAINLQGRKDLAILIGGEMPGKRITGLQAGESTLYDDQGQKVHVQRNGVRHAIKAHSVVLSDNVAEHRMQPGGYHIVKTDNIAKIRFNIGGNWFSLNPTALIAATPPPDDPTRT